MYEITITYHEDVTIDFFGQKIYQRLIESGVRELSPEGFRVTSTSLTNVKIAKYFLNNSPFQKLGELEKIIGQKSTIIVFSQVSGDGQTITLTGKSLVEKVDAEMEGRTMIFRGEN